MSDGEESILLYNATASKLLLFDHLKGALWCLRSMFMDVFDDELHITDVNET